MVNKKKTEVSPHMHINENKRYTFMRFLDAQKGPNKNLDLFNIYCAGFKAGYNYHRKHYGHKRGIKNE